MRFRPAGPAGPAAPAGLEVSLVSAIHIADQPYYAELNERFRGYDAVLYELIAPADTRVPLGGGEQKSLLSSVQLAITTALGLTFQLNEVDYTRPNLIHSDLSPDEMAASMRARGESLSNYFWRALAVSLNEAAKNPRGPSDVGLLMALFSVERERLLKIQFATSMLNMDTVTAIFEGPDGSTLIGERSKRVISGLQERIRRGDRRIAIFYGAGHMNDLATRLESELGLVRDGVVWLDAWDLR